MHPIFLFILVVFGVFTLVFALASYLKFERLMDARTHSEKGISARTCLQLQLVRKMAPGWGSRQPFVLVLFELGSAGADGREAGRLFESVVRSRTRKTDEWFDVGDHRYAMVLPMLPEHASSLLRRLFDAAAVSDDPAFPRSIRAGVAAYPADATDARRLLSLVEQALERAQPESAQPWDGAREKVSEVKPAEDPENQALIDPLTGVLHPERLGPTARKILSRRKMSGKPVSVLHMDINRMHEINERYGQSVGDAVLRNMGECLSNGVREADLIGRLDGDDFIVIVEAAPAEAEAIGMRLIEAVRRSPVQTGRSHLHLSLSIGCAGYPDFRGTFAELFEAAGLAMRSARQTGSNLCVGYRPDLRKRVQISPVVEDRF